MTIAMQPIYTQTVGSGGASSITFNNIPQTFTDLLVFVSGKTTDTSLSNYVSDCLFRINGNTSGYSETVMRNNSGTPSSFRVTNYSYGLGLANNGRLTTANTFANSQMYIPNYTSNNFKSYLVENATESNTANFDSTNYGIAGLWSNTSAITSLVFVDGYANFAQYSTISLYGITKG
jgi:hypothetical protein